MQPLRLGARGGAHPATINFLKPNFNIDETSNDNLCVRIVKLSLLIYVMVLHAYIVFLSFYARRITHGYTFDCLWA